MKTLANKFRVAVYDEFLDAFAKLPRKQQKKVSKFMRKFRANPTDPSIDYESISTFKDPNMRTVRIDLAYRAIVLKPEQGNVYVLLWVDHHDKAHAWAENKLVSIHPETGALQMLAADHIEAPAPDKVSDHPPPPGAQPLFGQWTDEELMALGIPQQLLATIREIVSSDQLEALSEELPESVYEALMFLALGESLYAVRDYLGLEKTKAEVDTSDFEAALETVSSQRHFRIVEDDEELEAMLDAPLEKWRVFLHPSQRKLVTAHFNGPARVLGGAGTGKTVVAMHRAKYLAMEVFPGDDDRLLFTTFTTNLAEDIRGNLQAICSPSVMRRIEVTPLDQWVAKFLRGQGYDYRIAYWGARDGLLEGLWEEALGVMEPDVAPKEFYREEWDAVVQAEGVRSYAEYKKIPRVGRGKRLSRQQRKAIWPVFEEYRNLLETKNLREAEDAMRDAAEMLRKLGPGKAQYTAVVVDEAQDMSTAAFELLRAIIPEEQPNDLFIVGDGHQRIYRRRVVLSHAGVHIVGRARKLYINYRTTDEIRRFAVSILRDVEVDDLDEGKDDNKKYMSLVHGLDPEVQAFDTFAEEVDAIAKHVESFDDPREVCLVTRTHRDLDQYETALQEKGIETYRLRRRRAEDHSTPGLRLATMHRVKGLEFDQMVVAGCNEGRIPLQWALRSADKGVRAEAELQERALFYVATTRARRGVLITSYGTPSPWVGTAAAAE